MRDFGDGLAFHGARVDPAMAFAACRAGWPADASGRLVPQEDALSGGLTRRF
jgi:hypothetical protein